jgi:ArsR family transcriptional regulator, arsenate/arsenite/antimonite-responsive transcriptional repressor
MTTHAQASPTVFRALVDPTRRDILQMLRAGPLNSGEIAAAFDATWPTISRHLGVLRRAGLVRAVRQKQEIRYELNTSVLQDLVQHLLDAVAPVSKGSKVANRRRGARRMKEV